MNQATGAANSSAPHVLELTVRSCAELFDSSAPACLGYQTVHDAIVEHLLVQAAAAPRSAPLKLRLLVPAEELVRANANTAALRAYLAKCRDDERRRIKLILWDGRISLCMGLVFVLFASAIGEGIRATFSGKFASAVASGLEIFACVALWRPAEFLLYDWIPVRRKMKLLARLAAMEIEYCPTKP
jgi:hypothetical protein